MSKSARPAKVKEVLSESTEVDVFERPEITPFQLPAAYRVKKVITVPSLTIKNQGDRRILIIVSEMRISKVVDPTKPDEKPATICDVGDVETGESFILLVPTVVSKNLEENYPNGEYVGKTFYIENMGKRKQSQRYYDFKIVEVEANEQ